MLRNRYTRNILTRGTAIRMNSPLASLRMPDKRALTRPKCPFRTSRHLCLVWADRLREAQAPPLTLRAQGMLWRYRSAQRRSSPAPRNISSNWIKRNQTTHRDRFKVGLYLYRVKLFSTDGRFYTLSWAEAWHCHPFHRGAQRPEGTLRAHLELTEYIRLF